MPRSEISDLTCKIPVGALRPIGDYILIEVMERAISGAGIILPHKENTECLYGRVIGLGEGEVNPVSGKVHPIGVKLGDVVMSVQYMGEKVSALGKKYRLLREHGIWAKLTVNMKSETDWSIEGIEPYRDHILLQMDREEKSLKGHIFLPSNPQAMFRMANVIKVGPGRRYIKSDTVTPVDGVSAGDRVICLRYAGCIVRMNKQEYRLASEEDLQAVVDGTEVDVIATDQSKLNRPVDDYDVIPDSHLDELNKKTIMDSGGKL